MSDLKKVQIAGLACLILASVFLYLRVGLPILVDLHDDFALLIAAVATFIVMSFAFLASRRLYAWAALSNKTNKGDL